MASYSWVHAHVGTVPHNAVEGGRDYDGCKIYIGRSHFLGDQIPCKVIPQRREAFVTHNCREHRVTSYEVLCERKLRWIPNSGGCIPCGAVPGGRTSSGEVLYVGRVRHGTSETVGKVHPSHGCLYIGYGGHEHSYKSYEILVMQ